jgi:hypothetical protein
MSSRFRPLVAGFRQQMGQRRGLPRAFETALGPLGPEDIQGWAVNRGLKCFFSMNRLPRLIEASFRPEKHWLMCVGLLANHLFSSHLIFLRGGFLATECAACFAEKYRCLWVLFRSDGRT